MPQGSETVLISGRNFGPGRRQSASVAANDFHTVTAEYGPNNGNGVWYKAQCTVTTAHTALSCTSVAGVGANHVWRIKVGGLTGAVSTVTTSYQPPAISLIRDSEGAVGASTRGGERVTLEGTNFGPSTPTGTQLAQFGGSYGVSGDRGSWYVDGAAPSGLHERVSSCSRQLV